MSSRPHLTPKQRAEIVELYEHEPVKIIARLVGCAPSVVSETARHHGLARHTRQSPVERGGKLRGVGPGLLGFGA